MALQYSNAFRSIEEMSCVAQSKGIRHAHHLFIFALNLEKLRCSRDEFMQALKKENIGVGLHFRALHVQPFYRDNFKSSKKDLPVATKFSERILSLPLYPKMTHYDVETVIKAVKKLVSFYKK